MSNLSTATFEADYLIVGAGAMGMAFADTLLAESDATVAIVDRRAHPGGHWNDAYPFVQLHSASAYYGVNSRPLGNDSIDAGGLNSGFYEQATAAEIRAYYDEIMREQFEPTGRVHYFPMCNHVGGGRLVSPATGSAYQIKVRKKTVDATFSDTKIPSLQPPKFPIAPGSRCIPPNDLPKFGNDANRYVVVGAGKTAIDVCLWLLAHDVPADRIVWIMPRDSWLIDRTHVQPRAEFFLERMAAVTTQLELIRRADSIEHLFELLDERRQLLRIDERVVPSRFRCATVSKPELDQLRRIRNVVRLGHVQAIESERIVLELGTIDTDEQTIHVDCSASGVRTRSPLPIFDGNRIALQYVRTCQPCFSAAFIAHVELAYGNDAEKNSYCKPIPMPILNVDWLKMFLANLGNQYEWSRTPELRKWIAQSRLDPNFGRTDSLTPAESALVQRYKEAARPATEKLRELLATPQREATAAI